MQGVLTNQERLDMLRGFSGAEKLAYDEDVRKCVRDHGSLSLHTLVGCPPIIFYRIGQVLESGKSYLAGDLSVNQFQEFLIEAEKFFRGWDPDLAVYPTGHQEWRYLAEAYRHACLLRVLRFPDAFAISCDDPRIKTSVTAIFDACAAIPRDTAFYKRLLFPLFLAGADTSSPHQMHYASWCIGEIKHATGFQHPAMTDVLTKVWEERRANPDSHANVPWMEFVCFPTRHSHTLLFSALRLIKRLDMFRISEFSACLSFLLSIQYTIYLHTVGCHPSWDYQGTKSLRGNDFWLFDETFLAIG